MDTNYMGTGAASERGGESFELDPGQRSWLLLVGVPLAIVGALLAVAALPDHMVAVVLGIGLFLAGTVTALAFTGYAPRASTYDAMQLGPDPEQVIGRQTGARI